MSGAVFLWGLLEDQTFRSVYECLQALRSHVLFFNHAAIARQRVKLAVDEGVVYTLLSKVCHVGSIAFLQPIYGRTMFDCMNRRATRLTPAHRHKIRSSYTNW